MQRAKAFRFAFIAISVVLLVILASGVTYEFSSRLAAIENFPPPGRMIDIGGRRIQLDCRGTGLPVVVLEAGMDLNGSLAWARVHDDLAAITRTCAYSRAGMLWSDPAPGARNGTMIASDLHATLSAAKEQPPFILVGHSLGGPYISIYTKHFRQEVAGLILVDPSHPDQIERTRQLLGRDGTGLPFVAQIQARLSWTGINRLNNIAPADTKEAAILDAFRPTTLTAAVKEVNGRFETFAEAGSIRDFGNLPLIVLSGPVGRTGDLKELWEEFHRDEATWSTAGEYRLIADADHYIQNTRPTAVVDAVRSMVEDLRIH